MDREFCKLIDQDDLIEKYIEGELHGEILSKFIEHLSECEEHARAVSLEKALQRGVRDFARSELKSNLRHHIKKQEISKYYILRYAAVLVVAIMAPIILYYQFGIKSEKTDLPRENLRSLSADQVENTRPEPEQKITAEPAPPELKRVIPARKPATAQISARPEASMTLDAAAPDIELIISPPAPELYGKILTYIMNNERQLLTCIPDSVKSAGQELTLQFYLNPDGKISGIQYYPDNLLPNKARLCMQDLIMNWGLPMPSSRVQIKKRIVL
jgi:hypothetical protein